MNWITLDSPLWVIALIIGTFAIGLILWEVWLDYAAQQYELRKNADLWREHQEVYEPKDENMGNEAGNPPNPSN